MNHVRNAVLATLGLILGAIALMVPLQPKPTPPPPNPFEVPVPLQEFTTADAGTMLVAAMPGTLPKSDNRQLASKGCEQALGQYVINGFCWQRLPIRPPCPADKGAFEHDDDHMCYVRVLRAEPIPTSGGAVPRGVAEP